ncbi:MAG: PQQ-binding-like beta-propeller repeat protein [Myxococcales bacterium]
MAERRFFGWAVVAAIVALSGCADAKTRWGGYVAEQRSLVGSATERVFSVHWWARADQAFELPYKPVEPSEPEVDPRSGNVFTVTGDGKVRAFDSRGRNLWEYTVGSTFDAGPTLAEGRLYVVSSKGQLIALDPANGNKIWEYLAGEELVTKPAVAEGLVVIGSTSDTIYAIDQAKGEWRWQYRRDPPSDFTVRGASRPIIFEGRVFAGFADGNAVALDAKDGTLQWAKDLAGGKPFADVDAGPVIDEEGRVYFASFATGVFALEAGTGKVIWTVERPNVSAMALSPDGKKLFVGGNGFAAGFRTNTGQVRWTVMLGADRFVSGMAVVNGLVLASTGSGPLLFLDGGTGELRRTFDPGHGVWAKPNIHGQAMACVLSNRGVVYDLGIEARGTP